MKFYADSGSSTTTTYSVTTGTMSNGSVTATPSSGIEAGDEVTLTIEPDTGYKFETLTVDDSNVTNNVSNNTYSFNMPAHNVTVNATFSVQMPGDTYELVTDASTLAANDEIIIVATHSDNWYAMSTTQNTNNRGQIAISVSNSEFEAPVAAQVLTLKSDGIGWNLYTGSGYLYAASSSNNYLKTEDKVDSNNNAKAVISINSSTSVATITFQGTNSHNTIRYNSSNNIFSCYESTSMVDVYVYRKVSDTPATYSITGIGTLTNGSVTASSASNIVAGTSVTLTIAPNTGYELATLMVDGSDVTSSVSSNNTYYTYTFTMPSHDVAVSATFSAISSGGSEQTATFIFNTSAGLAALGITEPTSSGAETDLGNNTYTVGDVTMSSTDGGTATRIYKSTSTTNPLSLRVYKNGGTLTYEVPTGYTITSIEITGSGLTNLSVSSTALTNGTDATWTGEAQSVTFTATDGATIYTVTVTYTAPGGGSTIATVEGIAAFKDLTAGTKARLHLSDGNNARVLHVASGTGGTTDAYVRDNTGAILIKGLTPNRPMAYNQHLAGWITGEYNVDSNGVPMFVTGSDTNTAFLVIADPVTEETTQPKTGVTIADLDDNLADWVVVKDINTGDSGNPTITNAFNTTGYAAPYSGAIVDVSVIVAGSDLLYPVSENNVPVLTYVLDASKKFTSPTTDISGATVRLAREFSAGVWTPLTVPFTMSADDFDGTVMEYTGLTAGTDTGLTGAVYDAGFMQFSAASTITAGVPYMVKATDDMAGLTVSNVTLSNTEAQTVTHRITASTVNPAPRRVMSTADEYSLVGTYSPTTVSTTDHTYKVITSSGTVGWADSSTSGVQGTGAYITSPAGQGVSLVMGDGEDSTITGVTDIRTDDNVAPVRTGIYNLMGVKMPDDWEQLPPGVYIVNGKKVIKQFNQ